MQYHHGNLKQQLIACAYESIASNGIDGISLRNIAKIAKVSPTAPYRHISSKEHLLADVAALGFDNLYDALNKKNETTGDPEEDLVKGCLIYIYFGFENRNILELMFHYPMNKGLFPSLLVSANKAFGLLTERIQRINGATAASSPLNSMSMLAYTHGLLNIIQNDELVDESADSDYAKASPQVKENLNMLLLRFVKNLDFS
jgi:AcrR family transcriptional regulator